jgi:uncharacterized cupin superfamily protein
MADVVIRKLNPAEIKKRGISSWPIWEKEVSTFDWHYDESEECLILEGEFQVKTDETVYNVKAGDFVTFSKGLQCVWDIKKPVRKHYKFF